MAEKEVLLAFDLYGTLLSTETITGKLSDLFGDESGQKVAVRWRALQLEYTWRLNSMQTYRPFSDVTRHSLQQTLAEHSLPITDTQLTDLMTAYDALNTFPDVGPALIALAQTSHVASVVFSNGTNAMVSNSVRSSPSLSPHASVFKDLVTVDEVQRYKPDAEVYRHLARRTGKEGQMGDIWLVSGNPFDIVGAKAVGMKAAWVDRGGNGWVDKLGQGPDITVKGLGEVVDAVQRHR